MPTSESLPADGTLNWGTPTREAFNDLVTFVNELEADVLALSSGGGGGSTGSDTATSVKDYGAAGNGLSDDTTAILAAMSAAGPYGELYFPTGTYLVSGNLGLAFWGMRKSGPGTLALEVGSGTASPVQNGTGYVGSLTSLSPYTALQVTGIDDAYEMIGYDILASGGGKSVKTRLQGPFIAATPGVDALQRIEEITLGTGYEIGPRSNLEIAMQTFATTADTTGAQFIPYHGVATTSEVRPATYRSLTGATVAMPAIGATIPLPNGLVVDQSIYGKHPSAPANQIRIDLLTKFHPDGMVEVEGTVTFLVATKVGAVYAPMTPYRQSDMNLLEHAGGTISLDPGAPEVTTNVDLPSTLTSGVLRSMSRPSIRVAWAWTNPNNTLRKLAADRKTTSPIIFIQRRTDSLNKVYPHAWQLNSVVPQGTSWTFGAQWRYMEVAS